MRHWLAAVPIALAALSAVPATAGADVLDTYQELASRRLSPAPLVPTVVPPSLRPYDRTVGLSPTRGGRGYSLRLVHYGPAGPDAIVVVTGGEFRSTRALLRDHRRLGFEPPRRTRVRGRRGYLLTRRLGPVVRVLAWVEGGVVYSVASGTPRKVSLGQLRSTASKLDRLERDWFGGASDPDNSSEAFAVSTERTVTVHVSFEASCLRPGATEPTIRVGQAGVTLLARDGDNFAFDVAEHRRGTDGVPWTGTVTGTIAPTGITLQVQASGHQRRRRLRHRPVDAHAGPASLRSHRFGRVALGAPDALARRQFRSPWPG